MASEMRFLLVVLVFASAAYGLSETCSLKLDQGKCRASHKRYGFDKKEGKCVEFVFGGCGGNRNNFETKEACEKECMMKNAGKKPLKKLASGSNSGQKLKKILLKEEEQKKVESLKKLASGSNSGQKLNKILLKEEEQKKVGAAIKKAIIKEKLKDSLPKPLIMNDQINLIVPKRNLSMAISEQKKLNLGKPQILPLHGMPQKEEQKKVEAAVKKAIMKEKIKQSVKNAIMENKLKQPVLVAS
ncbi:Kunitz/Bovine pancreatic trypsin inhibitor domain protein [Necator americanus]|uniref:Kunitz/Bovine pancreatic trypsin inhibitor domain protein n=1 Tax=Necator americanus TaxID=51031 RepID=W2TXF7_NECAM|nr:Kunitz/Bovine pancreatic trypsin inhibitor domain protein [Necator americanus]ETN86339.1 Kunitz/Bovine pancreatic trypsin inhibitor domain protein [Necator americanus]